MFQLGFLFSPGDICSKSHNMRTDLELVFTTVSVHFSVKLTVKEYTWYGTVSVDNVGLIEKQRHSIYQPSTKSGFLHCIKP